jgi:hypothetical protein
MKRDNQQERLFKTVKFDKNFQWYLVGFVDGEGSFCVSLKNKPDAKFKYQIDPSFYLYQHEKNKWILNLVKKFFHGGVIHRKTSPYSVFTYALHGVRNAKEKIIPFFKKHKLLVKKDVFDIFSQIVNMMDNKEHHSYDGFVKIVKLAYELNKMGKGRKWDLKTVLSRIPRD